MNAAIALRDSLRKIYAEYDVYLRPVLRFITAFAVLIILKAYLGFDEKIGSPLVILALSAFSMFFPWGVISLAAFGFVTAGFFSVSYSMALIAAVLFVLVAMLYFGFRPGNGIILILIPIGFILRIPYVVPVILGLSAGMGAVVPSLLGILSLTVLEYFKKNSAGLTKSTDLSVLMSEFVSMIKSIFTDERMIVLMLSVALSIIVVRMISRLSVDHAWTIAVAAGALTIGLTVFIGSAYLGCETDVLYEIISILTALTVALIYEFIFFNVDYRSKEFLQFEDDDYYYYVKAVPKVRSYDEEERRE